MADTKKNDDTDIIERIKQAKIAVREQAKNRVSRRLMLALRSEKCVCVCEKTGIVSLLEIPAIPSHALTYIHPLSDNRNARGIAQLGSPYLQSLETQILAGILITLADTYSLFHYPPSDSGAQKNALLRTAGKDSLINAIICIERFVNSGNQQYLPKLSLVFDSILDYTNINGRMVQYLKALVEAITKPDTTPMDLSLKKIGKIDKIKDRLAEQRTLEKKAKAKKILAQKIFETDKKAVKTLALTLAKQGKISDKLKAFLISIFMDDSILSMDYEARKTISEHTKISSVPELAPIIEMILADRKAITLDLSDLEDSIVLEDAVEPENDSTEDEDSERSDDNKHQETFSSESSLDSSLDPESDVNADSDSSEEKNSMSEAPVFKNPMERILWLKKQKRGA